MTNKNFVFFSMLIMLSSVGHAEEKTPRFVSVFAKEFAAKSLSHVESSRKNKNGDYIVNVLVSNKKCTVTVTTIEIEHKTIKGEVLEPLYRPTVSNMSCEPNEV